MMTDLDDSLHPVVRAAALLAAKGSYREASMLLGTVEGSAVERGLLEGRIAAQQHRYEEAVRAFEAVLAEAPDLPQAQRALDRARHFLARPRWARHARPLGAVFLAVTACTLVMGLALWTREGPTRDVEVAGNLPQPSSPVATADVRPYVAPRAEAPNLFVAAPGILIRTDGSERVVEFEAGLFDSGRAVIRADQVARLDAVGSALRTYKGEVRVTIEGHTDSSPLRPGKRYTDNTELAFARAIAVADHLRRRSGIAAESLAVRALGTDRARVPEEASTERARQRTVLLRVSSATSV